MESGGRVLPDDIRRRYRDDDDQLRLSRSRSSAAARVGEGECWQGLCQTLSSRPGLPEPDRESIWPKCVELQQEVSVGMCFAGVSFEYGWNKSLSSQYR